MMLMLILTPAIAAAVRGPTSNGAALDPRRLAGGDFALPERVLDDPNHAMHHSVLDACARHTLDECIWPDPDDV